MQWLNNWLTEEFTYWLPSGMDLYGKATFYSPATLSGRWEDRSQEYTTPAGEAVFSKAIVITQTVVPMGTYLYRGSSSSSDPTTVSGAYPAQRVENIDDLRRTTRVIRIML